MPAAEFAGSDVRQALEDAGEIGRSLIRYNLLQHRGYYGSIEASTEDNCLFGKLLFIRALVNYEGETVAELQAAFREAVNDFLATCQYQRKEPEVPCKGSFNVRIGHDLHLAASVAANRHRMSLNDLTRQALSAYLQHHG